MARGIREIVLEASLGRYDEEQVEGFLAQPVTCEECDMEGTREEIGICGDWIGTPGGEGYECADVICPACRD